MSLVLEDADGAQYYVGDSHDLLDCKTEQVGLYYCPASLFAFVPLTETDVCELSIIHKVASRSLSLCHYYHLAPTLYFHKSFMERHYFFLPESHVSLCEMSEGSSFFHSVRTLFHTKNVLLGFFQGDYSFGNTMAKIYKIIYTLKMGISTIKFVTNSFSAHFFFKFL